MICSMTSPQSPGLRRRRRQGHLGRFGGHTAEGPTAPARACGLRETPMVFFVLFFRREMVF